MDILEQAKNINKKVKEGKIFGKYTQEEAKAKLGENVTIPLNILLQEVDAYPILCH